MKVKRIILWVIVLCVPLLFTACSGKYLDGIVDAAPAASGFYALRATEGDAAVELLHLVGGEASELLDVDDAVTVAVSAGEATVVVASTDTITIIAAEGPRVVALPAAYSSIGVFVSPGGEYILVRGQQRVETNVYPFFRRWSELTLFDRSGQLLWKQEFDPAYVEVVDLNDAGETVVLWQKELDRLPVLLQAARDGPHEGLMLENEVWQLDRAGTLQAKCIIRGADALFAQLTESGSEIVVGFSLDNQQRGFVGRYDLKAGQELGRIDLETRLLDGAYLGSNRVVTARHIPPPEARPTGEVLVAVQTLDGEALWSIQELSALGNVGGPHLRTHLAVSPQGYYIALVTQLGTSYGTDKVSVYDDKGQLIHKATLGQLPFPSSKWRIRVSDDGSAIVGDKYYPGA